MNESRKGDIFILSEAFLWSLFPIVSSISLQRVPPLISLLCSVLGALAFFAVWTTIRRSWSEITDRSIWKNLFLAAVITGVGFYGLYFTGLRYTTPGNASFVALMEIFFSYLFFNAWKKEPFSGRHLAGAILMLLGAAIIISPKSSGINSGDFLVLGAVALAPVGNYFQRQVRTKISSSTLMFFRTLVTIPCIYILSRLLHQSASPGDIIRLLPFFAVNGIVLLGIIKIFWLEGIHRISVTRAAALSCIAPPCTLFFSWLFLGQAPTIWQLTAFFPLCAGLLLLTHD